MQFVVLMNAGSRDPHTAVHKLGQLEGIAEALLISNPYDIFVRMEAPSQIVAYQLLASVDVFENVKIHDVVYDPADHPDLITEVPWWNDASLPQPLAEVSALITTADVPGPRPASNTVKMAVARTPIIDSVPGMPPSNSAVVHHDISSQAGLATMASSGSWAGFGSGLQHMGELAEL